MRNQRVKASQYVTQSALQVPTGYSGGCFLDKDYAIEGIACDTDKGVTDLFTAWHRIWQLLAPAAERWEVKEPWTSAGACHAVAIQQAQIWVAWSYERRRIEGAVLSRVIDNPPMAPNNRVCECPLVGGENMAEWGGRMFAMIRAWAKAQGCDYLSGYGRRGWIRLFGFRECGKTPEGLPILVMPLSGGKE